MSKQVYRVVVMYGGRFKGHLAGNSFVRATSEDNAATFAVNKIREALAANRVVEQVELLTKVYPSSEEEVKQYVSDIKHEHNRNYVGMVN